MAKAEVKAGTRWDSDLELLVSAARKAGAAAMTYCVGIDVDEGLVFAADTRTSASFAASRNMRMYWLDSR